MIPIKNIYYMLTYAFQTLREQGFRDMETESFNNAADLCAAILVRGVSQQLKRGFHKDYVSCHDELSTLRGKIDFSETISSNIQLKRKLICTYDTFTEDSYPNQILATTMHLLLRSNITGSRKKSLRKLLIYFNNVQRLDPFRIQWNIQHYRLSPTYRMLISICFLTVKGLLQTQNDGSTHMMDYLDEQRMCRLYEKFILEYYRQEFPQISTSASQIPWDLDDQESTALPTMQTDVMMTYQNKILILDAKYYEHASQMHYGAQTLHSGNLYQIFTYVKNKAASYAGDSREVAGMLLYARTDEEIWPHNSYLMSGNRISVRTLDLNCDFDVIARQMNAIVEEEFGVMKRKE